VKIVKTNSFWSSLVRVKAAGLLLIVLLFQAAFPAYACGPETMEPLFVFENSPDLPFEEFATGKIGIVQPTFGRKTLVIAHRYLSGGSFSGDEQPGLVAALKGTPPEIDDSVAIKAWIAARKEVVGNEEKERPPIYDERRHGSYDFFPNCTANAFEVATQTLKDRVGSYGATDRNVRDWLEGQDIVFRNCAEGSLKPPDVAVGSPGWLRKDRDYQTAAAHFYSLNFKEARSRFAKIADDGDSVWQETSRYLVGRTLVREASLTEDEKTKRSLYEQAEAELINIMASGGKFQNSSKRLLGLVKFRLRPEERVHELAQTLEQTGNENVRQDLIDYTWLLDKFDAQVQKEEEEKKARLNPSPTPTPYKPDPEYQARRDALDRGDLIEFYLAPMTADGKPDFPNSKTFTFKSEITQAEVLQEVEIAFAKKLSEAEKKDLNERFVAAQLRREWLLSPNRKVDGGRDYEGCSECNELALDTYPAFLRADDLSDWILTFQSKDPNAFTNSVAKWRETRSTAWLLVALAKANKLNRSVASLIREGERIDENSPAFPTIAYHLTRLYVDLNRTNDAVALLDKILTTRFDSLPVSSQNLLLAQRSKLARTVGEFLRFAGRKPAAFYQDGRPGRLADLMHIAKEMYDPSYYEGTREDNDREIDERFKQYLPWEDRKTFDPGTADIFNWHFSVRALLDASRNSELPDYLRRTLAISAWTRAILLKNEVIEKEASEEVARLVPEMSAAIANYLDAPTRMQRDDEALYILLKFPNLSPYVPSGIPLFSRTDDTEYYFELSWWCRPEETEYSEEGNETPKTVSRPQFLGGPTLAAAKRERAALLAIGNAKSYLGKRVLDWARRAPKDPRIPEALYIGVQATSSYKYGCGSWEGDDDTRMALEQLLKKKYPQSSWTAKLREEEGEDGEP